MPTGQYSGSQYANGLPILGSKQARGQRALEQAQNIPRPRRYILADGVPWPESDTVRWSEWFGRSAAERQVGYDEPGAGVRVSTVFLGLDRSHGRGEPLLYETMVFGGEFDTHQRRYSTKEQALAGHEAIVERVLDALAPVSRPHRRLKHSSGKRNAKQRARRCEKARVKKEAKAQARALVIQNQDVFGDLAGIIQRRRGRNRGERS